MESEACLWFLGTVQKPECNLSKTHSQAVHAFQIQESVTAVEGVHMPGGTYHTREDHLPCVTGMG